MSYRERRPRDPRLGRGCVEQTEYERWTGLGPEVEGSIVRHITNTIKDASPKWRAAGVAGALLSTYLVVAALVPPARKPLTPIVEGAANIINLLIANDSNSSAPTSYPELLQQYTDISASTESPVGPEFIISMPDADESFAYQYAAGETGFLYP
jgi:hypothetical protein